MDQLLDIREPVRALCLLSGGLDSQLAVCVLRDQQIDLHGVVFDSPFFSPEAARRAAAGLALPLHEINFTPDILELVDHPPHGFGSQLNPCIDCHARMLRIAGSLMEAQGFHFLATGEVLNERPMSQNRHSLDVVARDSGYGDRVVRPLSARRLPPTLPEREGRVDRERLLDIQGRGRKRQIALARHYGLRDYPSPAGGCRLTEPGFCRRLRDLIDHEGLHGVYAIERLRFGRHLRLAPNVKVIVGRDEADNLALEQRAELYDLVLRLDEGTGPTAILPNTASQEQVREAAAICARYARCEADRRVAVRVRSSRGVQQVEVTPADDERCRELMV